MNIADLPPALTTEQAAELFGCSPDLLWKCAREHTAPVEPLRIGTRTLRWPTAKLLAALGLEQEEAPACTADASVTLLDRPRQKADPCDGTTPAA